MQALMKTIKSQLNLVLITWTYFTRIPLPAFLAKRVDFSQATLERSARYMSFIGIVIGCIVGAVFLVYSYGFSKNLAVLLTMVTSLLITGAFHEDAIADFFDGFGGGWWSKERIMEIMKDSRLGTFGSLALISSFAIKFFTLVELPNHILPLVIVSSYAISRMLGVSFIYTHQYVRENDASYFKPLLKDKMKVSDLIPLIVFGLMPTFFFAYRIHPLFLVIIPLLFIVRTLFGRVFIKKLGGYTGDCLGAVQQVTELSFYLLTVLILKFI
jgi:adenosylcobinamide-GDP ribazoletransferase